MKIISLEVENIKRVKCVRIEPDGNLVVVGGRNGQGKTSVLNSISWAIEGARHIQDKPIRKGAKTGHIRLDLGRLLIERTFKTGENGERFTTSIRVSSPDGALFSSPQAMLDKFLGALSFDPLAFSRMKAKDQFDTLKAFVPGIDFDQIAAQNAMDFDKRTALNREAAQAKAAAAEIEIPDDAPILMVDEDILLDEISDAANFNAEIEIKKRQREDAAEKMRAYLAESIILRNQADALALKSDELQAKLDAAPPLDEPKSVNGLRAVLNAVRQANEIVRMASVKATHEENAVYLREKVDALTTSIDKRNAAKEAAISAAKMPFDGVTFGDGEILLDGQPFEQGSDAEQLKAAIAMAMTMNSELRVILVRDGSLLDRDSMLALEDMSVKYDCQVIIERVGNADGMGFILEDGEIAGEETK